VVSTSQKVHGKRRMTVLPQETSTVRAIAQAFDTVSNVRIKKIILSDSFLGVIPYDSTSQNCSKIRDWSGLS